MDKAKTVYKKGKSIHRKERHDGAYDKCAEWVCISYKARARQVAQKEDDD